MNRSDIHTWALEGAVRAATVPPGADSSAIILEECAMIMRVGSSFGHNISKTEASFLLTSEFSSVLESAVFSAAMSSFAELNSGYLPNVASKIGVAATILELVGNAAFSYFEGKTESAPAQTITENKLYTVSEAADILSLSEYTVRQKIREGKIKAIKGKSDREGYKIRQEDLMNYLQKKGKKKNKNWISLMAASALPVVAAPIIAGAASVIGTAGIAPILSLSSLLYANESKDKSKENKEKKDS